MVRLFTISDIPEIERAGYSVRYYADLKFSQQLNTAGFIFIAIPAGIQTKPHAHEVLQELFIALTPLTMIVDEEQFDLVPGDLLLVDPKEFHSIKASKSEDSKLVAIKCPNMKQDKIDQVH